MFGPLSSTPFLSSVNLIEVFSNTDGVGQSITGLLGVFSIFAWSVMIGKYFELKRLRQLNQAFEYRLRVERKLLDLPEAFRN